MIDGRRDITSIKSKRGIPPYLAVDYFKTPYLLYNKGEFINDLPIYQLAKFLT